MANINNDRNRLDSNYRTDRQGRRVYDQVNEVPAEVHGRPVTREEVAYRNGYTEAQLRDQNRRVDRTNRYNIQRDADDRTATGVILGILLAAALGLIGGALYWASQANESATPVVDIEEPVDPANTSEDTTPDIIERNTTVIERQQVDRVQEAVPAEPPNVQINVPSPDAGSGVAPDAAAPAPSTTTAPDATTPSQGSTPQLELQPNEAAPAQSGSAPQSGSAGAQ